MSIGNFFINVLYMEDILTKINLIYDNEKNLTDIKLSLQQQYKINFQKEFTRDEIKTMISKFNTLNNIQGAKQLWNKTKINYLSLLDNPALDRTKKIEFFRIEGRLDNPINHFKNALKIDIFNNNVEIVKQYYDYTTREKGKSNWYVDFANQDLGGGVFHGAFVQEEKMCYLFPELMMIFNDARQKNYNFINKKPIVEFGQKAIEEIKKIEIKIKEIKNNDEINRNIDEINEIKKNYNPYENQSGAVVLTNILKSLKSEGTNDMDNYYSEIYNNHCIDKDTIKDICAENMDSILYNNIIALDAKSFWGIHGPKNPMELKHYSKGVLITYFTKAYNGFKFAKDYDMRNNLGQTVIYTGEWGAGVFYNNRDIMFSIQIYAALLAGCSIKIHSKAIDDHNTPVYKEQLKQTFQDIINYIGGQLVFH